MCLLNTTKGINWMVWMRISEALESHLTHDIDFIKKNFLTMFELSHTFDSWILTGQQVICLAVE